MSKTLVLAEKPSVGRDIARVLNCSKKLDGALEGPQYIVTWALGHLVTLADPEKYDKRYKSWDLEDLPIMPDRLSLVVIKQTGKQYNAVKKQMSRSDVKSIVIATDAGREGELVARWIIDKSGIKKPLKRLWISSVTDKAIKDGFKHLKDAKEYYNLYNSAKARAEADWIVGINATRALTCKHNAQLACGRVQTPTVAIINHRQEEIQNFVPRTYYGLKVLAKDINWRFVSSKNESSVFDENRIDSIIDTLANQSLKVTSVKKTMKKTYAPQLYDLTELQRDANKLYNYSAKDTLSIMQGLYEYHKVLTYPRTDSRYLTDDIVPTLKERLEASLGGYYDNAIHQILKKPIQKKSHFVNNSKVSDHHAIIPTEQPAMIGAFDEGERRIYDLVVKRFLAVLLPPYEYEQTSLVGKIANEEFKAKGKIEHNKGWKIVYENYVDEDDTDDMQEQTLPPLKNGDTLSVQDVQKITGQTTPPPYFNEATLLSAMENPAKYMQSSNKEYNATLTQTGGLGTVATRADIIEKLFNIFLIEKSGKDIRVTAKGRQLLSLVPKDLRSPELTARWELDLGKIAQGKLPPKAFLKEIREYAEEITEGIKTGEAKFKHDNMTNKKCPECQKPLLEVNGKRGKMLICSDRECRYRETLSIVTNARCPNCHKKMELVGKDDKQLFVCKTCGHRQSMKAFKKDKEGRQNSARKNDVNKYMREQKKQQTQSVEDSPFAALLKLKDDLK
ncbi:MAG: DNA topoisomerase III [Coprobacillaceae bacterium]